MSNKLTTKEFWVNPEHVAQFNRHTDHNIDGLIKKYIPKTQNGHCLEIGSYPGPFLATFGDLGYTLNGIDFHPDNVIGLPNWLRSRRYKVGDFVCMDFFDFNPEQKFEIVASFGFIEHFENFQEVIKKHLELIEEDGYLVMTTPNFKGFVQHWLHKNFDKENLALHNIKSMDPQRWKDILEANGFEVIFQGFFGEFWFWHGHEKLPEWKAKTLWAIERMIPRIRKFLRYESEAFSAYAGIVARRTKKQSTT